MCCLFHIVDDRDSKINGLKKLEKKSSAVGKLFEKTIEATRVHLFSLLFVEHDE